MGNHIDCLKELQLCCYYASSFIPVEITQLLLQCIRAYAEEVVPIPEYLNSKVYSLRTFGAHTFFDLKFIANLTHYDLIQALPMSLYSLGCRRMDLPVLENVYAEAYDVKNTNFWWDGIIINDNE